MKVVWSIIGVLIVLWLIAPKQVNGLIQNTLSTVSARVHTVGQQ
jgi:hypothetical protein